MAQDLNELQRLEFKEAFEEFDKVREDPVNGLLNKKETSFFIYIQRGTV